MAGLSLKSLRTSRPVKKNPRKPVKKPRPRKSTLKQIPGYGLVIGALRNLGRTMGEVGAFDLFRCDAVDRAACACRAAIAGLFQRIRPSSDSGAETEDPPPHFVYVMNGAPGQQRELLSEYVRGTRWREQVLDFVGIERDGTIVHADLRNLCPTSDKTMILWVMGTPVREGTTYERLQEFLCEVDRGHEALGHIRQLVELDLERKRFRHLNLFLFDTAGLIIYSVSFEYPRWNRIPREGCLSRLGEMAQQVRILPESA